MAVKDTVMGGIGRIMQSDQAMKLMQNEAFMKALMKGFTVSAEARTFVQSQVHQVVRSLRLVTADELKAVKRQLERVERELAELQRRTEDALVKAEEALEVAGEEGK
ncbi:MAG: hypothetical protein ACE366_05855 [Bradymonadia bacterium]